MTVHKKIPPNNIGVVEDPKIILVFSATLENDVSNIKAATSTKERGKQLNMMFGILQSICTELSKDFDTPQVARILTDALENALNIVNPADAQSLHNMRQKSLPNLKDPPKIITS